MTCLTLGSRPAKTHPISLLFALAVWFVLFASAARSQSLPADRSPPETDRPARSTSVAVSGAGTTAVRPAGEQPARLEAFEVTGSRIKRIDAEGPAPVITFTADEIAASNAPSLSDFMQAQSFNSGGVNVVANSNTATPGASTLNPRGLGASRFLVLVNGRRPAAFGLTNGSNQSVFDFNSLPQSVIERVEYLKDGASAIYGSDAISGVMNVILKKSFSGISTEVKASSPQHTDALSREAQIVFGTATRKSSLLVGLGWQSQHDTFLHDFARSRTTDYTHLGPVKGTNFVSIYNNPPSIFLSAAQATTAGSTAGSGYYVLNNGPTANPALGGFTRYVSVPTANRFDFADYLQLTPRRNNWNAYAYGTYRLSPATTLFAQLSYSDIGTRYLRPGGQITTTTAPGLTLPAANPYNPFRSNLLVGSGLFWHTTLLGRTRLEADSRTLGLLDGAKGSFGENWTWESGVNFGQSRSTRTYRNLLVQSELQAALNGTTRATALNPFGPSDNPDLVSGLAHDFANMGTSRVYGVDLGTGGKLFTSPAFLGQPSAGDVSVALGAETRGARLVNATPTASFIALGTGTPYTGSRTVHSQYAELRVPVLPRYLELQLAVRHEHYSDFGGATRAKLAFVSQPFAFLKIRGSTSQSFSAPSLGQLYTTRSTGFVSGIDPATGQSGSFREIIGGNPALKPETSHNWFGGAVVDLGIVAKGLTFSADYLNIRIENYINTYTSVDTLVRYFGDRVYRNPDGTINYLDATPNNAAVYTYRGLDLGLAYDLPRTRFGRWRFHTAATRLIYLAFRDTVSGTSSYAGHARNPRWNGTAQVTWSRERFGASLSTIYTGAYFNDNYQVASAYSVWGENPRARLNATVSCTFAKRTRLTLGCENFLATEPPANGRTTAGFDQSLYQGYAMGRVFSLRVKRDF